MPLSVAVQVNNSYPLENDDSQKPKTVHLLHLSSTDVKEHQSAPRFCWCWAVAWPLCTTLCTLCHGFGISCFMLKRFPHVSSFDSLPVFSRPLNCWFISPAPHLFHLSLISPPCPVKLGQCFLSVCACSSMQLVFLVFQSFTVFFCIIPCFLCTSHVFRLLYFVPFYWIYLPV